MAPHSLAPLLLLLSLFSCTSQSRVCEEGWTGPDCSIPLCSPECRPPRGTCTSPGLCTCAPGWSGSGCRQCQTRAGCLHGRCTIHDACQCDPGWTGPLCDTPVCSPGCHATQGYCDRPGVCRCRPGWTGHLCRTPVCEDSCSRGHGRCTAPGDCRCEVGWWGDGCDLCFPYPGCQHGTCTQPWECHCLPGWTGPLCDTPDDTAEGKQSSCSSLPHLCLNGGTCRQASGSHNFTCSCPESFTGPRCDYLVSDTQDRNLTEEDGSILSTATRRTLHILPPDPPSRTPSSTPPPDTAKNTTNDSRKATTGGKSGRVQSLEEAQEERRRLLQKIAKLSFRQRKTSRDLKETEEEEEEPTLKVATDLLPLPIIVPRVTSNFFNQDLPHRHKSPNKLLPPTVLLDVNASSSSEGYLEMARNTMSPDARRNLISGRRRHLRHHRPAGDGPALVQVFNSFNRPILVSAHARALPNQNPITPASLRPSPRPSLLAQRSTTSAPAKTTPTTQRPRPQTSTTAKPEPPATDRVSLEPPSTYTPNPQIKVSVTPRNLVTVSPRPQFPEVTSRQQPQPEVTSPRPRLPVDRSSQIQIPVSIGLRPQLPDSGRHFWIPEETSLNPYPEENTDSVLRERAAVAHLDDHHSASSNLGFWPEVFLEPESDFNPWEVVGAITTTPGPQSYYEENYNGRVHIGDVGTVDDGGLHKEIYDAFIELKKV